MSVSRNSSWLLAFTCSLLLLAACTLPSDLSEDDTPAALLSDADIDQASLRIASSIVMLSGREGEALPARETETGPLVAAGQDLRSTGLPAASGILAFVRHNPTLTYNPWMVWLLDPQTSEATLVYGGRREVQSVAVSAAGDTLVLAMRRTLDASGNFEVYRVTLSDSSVERLTHTPYDEQNVSMSADGSLIVWEGENAEGKRAVVLREGSTEHHLALALEQRQPSVSSSGRYLALIRELANGNLRVVRYEVTTNSYQVVWGRSQPAELASPSVSNDGTKLAWLESLPEGVAPSDRQLVRYYDANTGTVGNAVGVQLTDGPRLAGPHLAGDGDHLAFAWRQGEAWNLFIRRVSSGDTQRVAARPAPVTHHAPYWQMPVDECPHPDYAVYFPDPNVEAVVREELNKPEGPITCADMEELHTFRASGEEFFDLEGLQHGINLLVIDIRDTSVTSYRPLSGLTPDEMHLHNNPVRDFSNLTLRTRSTELEIIGHEIETMQGARLFGAYLTVADGKIHDLSGASLGNDPLLFRNEITHIPPDVSFSGDLVDLSYNLIRDLSNVTPENFNTFELRFRDNLLTNISPLLEHNWSARGLWWLVISDNCLDLTPGSQAMRDIETFQERDISVSYEPQRDLSEPPCSDLPHHTLNVEVHGNGTVTSDPAGIDCGEDCEEEFLEYRLVTLTATPATGSNFIGWDGDCESVNGNTCRVTMDATKEVTAVFSVSSP